MAIEIREETPVRMYIGRVDGLVFTADSFYGMTSPSCVLFPPALSLSLPRLVFFFLLSSDNDRERYIELHAPFNRERYPGVSR